MKEVHLYERLAHYIAATYPGAVQHWDLMGVNNPSPVTRALYSRLNSRAWPDLFVASPVLMPDTTSVFHGLMLEIKVEGTQLKRTKDCTKMLKGDYRVRKAGDWWDLHIEEQAIMLAHLQDCGFVAQFGVGYADAVSKIDSYFSGMGGGRIATPVNTGDEEVPF